MKVFIEPNTENISSYFDKIFDLINKGTEDILKIKNHLDISQQKNIELFTIKEHQDAKQKIEYSVLQPIEMSHNFISSNLPSQFLMDIEDCISVYMNEIVYINDENIIIQKKFTTINYLTSVRTKLLKSINYPLINNSAFL